MQTKLFKSGNSHSIRIPVTMLKEAGLGELVEMTLEGKSIVIKPLKNPREGWADDAAEMAALGEDILLIPDAFDDEDLSDWTWPVTDEDQDKS